ncbi:hypothetical protein SOCEGT47_081410 [Sorangium cellulosum]|uniref:DUF3540 domain-containing protein n=1 Tax=Sorangium cellulosum TaxID=56 RepID=A0A4P2QCR3_SORCE|nr:DUF3540 domain-containing protein [Sorangium cellulosum]AUX27547.1 hypothetical protein SOCEGT47_081410 [Sorangium cellulosum]
MTAAKKLARPETYLEAGRVERVGEAVVVRLASGSFEARRAKSCLVAPEAGDKVLCAVEPEGVYLLAVLEGRGGAPTKLATDGDLEVQARGGRVAVCASERVDIVGAREVAVTGAEVHVRARKGSVAIEELGFFGRLVQAEVARVALVAQEVDSRLTRLTQRVKRVFRFVEELDQTRAGTVDLRAESLLGLRGENAVISARVLAKIDGEQIHIG